MGFEAWTSFNVVSSFDICPRSESHQTVFQRWFKVSLALAQVMSRFLKLFKFETSHKGWHVKYGARWVSNHGRANGCTIFYAEAEVEALDRSPGTLFFVSLNLFCRWHAVLK
jgi:hypothetical protein